MYYFVPSWYAAKGKWEMTNEPWYHGGSKSEFDDTVSQIRMFRKEGEDVTLVLLAYNPQLRRFMHRQNIWPINVWSAFDVMQGMTGNEVAMFGYRDLKLPTDIEWAYAPFSMLGYLDDELSVVLHHNGAGAVMRGDYYEAGAVRYRVYFDDRGYISTIGIMDGDLEVATEFYSPAQKLQFTWDRVTDAVIIQEKTVYAFRHSRYESMADLLSEVYGRFSKHIKSGDVVLLAADPQHDRLVMDHSFDQCIVLSFFGDRYDVNAPAEDDRMRENLQKDVDAARFLVTDTEALSSSLRENCDLGKKKILDISPFDTRLSLGKSQQIKDLRVFVPIDGMQEPIRTRALKMMIEVLQTDERIKLILVLRAGTAEDVQKLRAEMAALADTMKEGPRILVEEPSGEEEDGGENFFGAGPKGEREPQISVYSYFQEMELMSQLRYVRLIVDIRDNPDQYIQIAGISAGIPQINYLTTRYIIDHKNGYMIHNIAHLKDAMLHYLEGLSNWNEALVYCVQQVEQYSGKHIVSRWKELIKQSRENELSD